MIPPQSDDGVAAFLEDAEGARAQGHEVSVAVADFGLDGGDTAGAVDDLGGAGDPTLPHGAEEVDVEADGRRPQADERGHGEPHRVVHQGGVDAAVQRPVAVEVDVLHVYVADGLPRFDFLDFAPYVAREGHFLVEVLREPGQLVFVQVSYGLFHRLSFRSLPRRRGTGSGRLGASVARPAGDVEYLPAHESGLLGGEVQDGGGHVLGPSRAACRDVLHALGDEVVEIHAEAGRGLAGHLRLYKTRGSGVHGDPVAAQLDGERLGEALDAGLGRRVVGLATVAERAQRRDVDDPAVVPRDHVFLGGPGAKERAAEVDVQYGAPVLVCHLVEQVVPRYTGVVDQDVQAPVAVHDLPDGPLDIGAARDVHFGREGVHTLVHELACRRERALQLHVREAHQRALAGEAPRRGLTDTA